MTSRDRERLAQSSDPTRPSAAAQPLDPTQPSDPGWSVRVVLPLTLVVLALGVWLSNNVVRTDVEISEVWMILAASTIALVAVHQGGREGRVARLGGVALLIVVLYTAISVASGSSWSSAVYQGFVDVVAAFVALTVYRVGKDHPGWDPRTPRSLFVLVAATLASAGTVVALGGHPWAHWPPGDVRHVLWWFLRISTGTWVGLATFFAIAYWRLAPVRPRPGAVRAAMVYVCGLASIGLAYGRHDLPISWLCLVPGLWAGLTFAPRAAALYSLTVAVFAGSTVTFMDGIFDYAGLLPPSILIDLMLCFATFLTMLLSVFTDQRARLIGELRDRRAAARAQADLLRTMMDSMSDGIVLGDASGVRAQNRASRRYLRPLPDTIPKSWAHFLGVRTVDGDREVTDEELPMPSGNGAKSDESLYRVVGSDGVDRVVAAESRMMRTRSGPMMLMVFHDVSVEHARYRELRTFAGTVAHDLKGPLAAVSGWMEAAGDELAAGDPVAGRLALVRARQASTRMRALIDEYLSFAVAREGALRMSEVSLDTVCREVADVFDTGRDDDPIIDIDVRHSVHADSGLMRQLVANLIGNAVKYTPPDRRPQVYVSSMAVGPDRVRLEFADRGIGLAPGDEERIFQAFERSERDAAQFSGTGLGLALCHSIVSRHGGTISAHGNEHGGATFVVTLPTAGPDLSHAER